MCTGEYWEASPPPVGGGIKGFGLDRIEKVT